MPRIALALTMTTVRMTSSRQKLITTTSLELRQRVQLRALDISPCQALVVLTFGTRATYTHANRTATDDHIDEYSATGTIRIFALEGVGAPLP